MIPQLSPMQAMVLQAMAAKGGASAPPMMPGLGGDPLPPMGGVPPGMPAGQPPPGVPVQPGGVAPTVPGPNMPTTDLPPIRAGGPPLMGPGGNAGNPPGVPTGGLPGSSPSQGAPQHQPWDIVDQGNGTAVIRAKGPDGRPGPVVKVIRIKRQENELHEQQLQNAQ
jgi:hypothetical protein